MQDLSPCPDPNKYTHVKTKEGSYWRRKRGTVKPATLNEALLNNVRHGKIVGKAATRIIGKLQPFLHDLDTGRLNMRIMSALRKTINETGTPDYRYLADTDLPRHPMNRLLRAMPDVQHTAHEVIITIAIDDATVDKKGKSVTGYYFEAISLYGDMTVDYGLRIDSVISPLYSFEKQPETECVLTLSTPPNTHPWMILLKVSCQEADRPSVSGRHFGLKVIMAGLPSKEETLTSTASGTGPISPDSNPSASLLDQLPDRLLDQSATLLDHPQGLLDQSARLLDQLPAALQTMIGQLGKRLNDKEKMNQVILALCAWQPQTLQQLSARVQRKKKYLLEFFIHPLREKGLLAHTIPDSPNHPEQAYKAVD